MGEREGDATASDEVDFTDDRVLVAALRRGDEEAFSWLLDRYDASLRRMALGFVSTPAVADEVVQETWLGVIKGIDRFEGRSSLKTWIYRIMMNIARTRGVRESRSVPFASLGGDGSEGEQPAFSPDRFQGGGWTAPPAPWDELPVERLEAKDTLAQVRAALAELPPSQRLVMSMRDLDGATAEEVCDLLEISPGNQRVLLHRARAKVRQRLEDALLGDDVVRADP